MSSLRVVVAYLNSPWTTANYLVDALRRCGADVVTAGPGHDLSFPRRGFPRDSVLDFHEVWRHLVSESLEPDLILCVDAGGTLYLPGLRDIPIPVAYYSIDGHRFPLSALAVGAQFDVTFAAQRPLAEFLASRGLDAEWLPLAVDPEVFAPCQDSERDFEFVFVGNPYTVSTLKFVGATRRHILASLSSEYSGLVIGTAPQDASRQYARGLVGLNVAGADRSLDVNMRTFEIPACGVPLLTNGDYPSLRQLFVLGAEIAYFSTLDECRTLLRRLIDSPALREHLARAGHERVVASHTYRHRAEQILSRLEGVRPRRRARRLPSARVRWWQSRVGVRPQSPVLGKPGPSALWGSPP